jgi:hypothetical protein
MAHNLSVFAGWPTDEARDFDRIETSVRIDP